MKNQPTPNQQEIIDAKGNIVVTASAGTGKTFTMVEKIIKETENENTHKVIAAITFTIKAANEIKERLGSEVKGHFINTTNSFAINEVIRHFFNDAYKDVSYRLTDFDTDYTKKFYTFYEGLNLLYNNSIIGSLHNNKENFVFKLAMDILKKSKACRLYLKAKFKKIYIDEYQDCDKDMSDFFMYLCDNLKIETFVVGDDKQSIYIWRGAYPEAFKSIKDKDNFYTHILHENHRSSIQIQNYSNLLFGSTAEYYQKITNTDEVIAINNSANALHKVIENLDLNKSFAILRSTHNDAIYIKESLEELGVNCVYIPRGEINDITTNASWLYHSIAQYIIFKEFSVYHFINTIPVEVENIKPNQIKKLLDKISKDRFDEEGFIKSIKLLAEKLSSDITEKHARIVYHTINNKDSYIIYKKNEIRNAVMTIHSSKGLEFDK